MDLLGVDTVRFFKKNEDLLETFTIVDNFYFNNNEIERFCGPGLCFIVPT